MILDFFQILEVLRELCLVFKSQQLVSKPLNSMKSRMAKKKGKTSTFGECGGGDGGAGTILQAF